MKKRPKTKKLRLTNEVLVLLHQVRIKHGFLTLHDTLEWLVGIREDIGLTPDRVQYYRDKLNTPGYIDTAIDSIAESFSIALEKKEKQEEIQLVVKPSSISNNSDGFHRMYHKTAIKT